MPGAWVFGRSYRAALRVHWGFLTRVGSDTRTRCALAGEAIAVPDSGRESSLAASAASLGETGPSSVCAPLPAGLSLSARAIPSPEETELTAKEAADPGPEEPCTDDDPSPAGRLRPEEPSELRPAPRRTRSSSLVPVSPGRGCPSISARHAAPSPDTALPLGETMASADVVTVRPRGMPALVRPSTAGDDRPAPLPPAPPSLTAVTSTVIASPSPCPGRTAVKPEREASPRAARSGGPAPGPCSPTSLGTPSDPMLCDAALAGPTARGGAPRLL